MRKTVKNVLCILICLTTLSASIFVSNAADYQDEEIPIDVFDDGLNQKIMWNQMLL